MKTAKRVSINWFQQEIDDPNRNWSFVEKQGNLIKFLHNRHQWYYYPKMSKVCEFPLHVDIEVSAVCDLECPMCPRRHADVTEYTHMDIDLFRKIVDECAEYKLFSARLSWRGESLTHPHFSEFIYYIKKIAKIPNVSFLTNGRKMTEEIAENIVEAGIDYVSFSVDGIGDVYNMIRAPLKFEMVYNSICMLKAVRDKAGKDRPQIRVSSLWPAVAQDPDEYFKVMRPLVDKIVSNPVKDYRVTAETRFKQDYICQYPWERLFVGSDGRVQPCSNSIERLYIGDSREETLAEIWKGKEMEKLRKAQLENRSNEYFACSRCSYKVDVNFNEQFEKDWSGWDPGILAQPVEE
mgnify:CR=1 FL=1